jgi:urate oxidase
MNKIVVTFDLLQNIILKMGKTLSKSHVLKNRFTKALSIKFLNSYQVLLREYFLVLKQTSSSI